MILETPRLILRDWRDADRAPFAAMCADPVVMEHFERPQTRAETDAAIDRVRASIRERGYGFWALERKDTGDFIGFTGLNTPSYPLPFGPCVEIGWRLARSAWGHGFATKAATASLDFGFDRLGLPDIVAFTALTNLRSQAVMERLGMIRDVEFDHPHIPEGHRVRRHINYRITRDRWQGL